MLLGQARILYRRRRYQLTTLTNNAVGDAPREFLSKERLNNPQTLFTRQDIYNAKKKLRKRRLGRYTPTQCLLRALHRNRWFVKVALHQKTKEIKRLFFVDKEVIDVLYKNSEVLIMDCTYKTNKYKMPLLAIVGHTSIGTTFIVGFAFLAKETKEYYNWVLYQLRMLYDSLGLAPPRVIATDRELALMEAIEARFPRPTTKHILCLWHVHRNVAKNCKASFATDEEWEAFLIAWHAVIYASTVDDLTAAWTTLVKEYAEEHYDDVDYVFNTWLEPWRTRLCKAYTNDIMHFGTTTTSRVEGIHRVLKTNLKFSTGDLMAVVDSIETLLINQRKDYNTRLANAKRNVPWEFNAPVFRNLIGRVTAHAIWKIHEQYERLRAVTEADPLPPCTKVFFSTMGLPCSHMIKARMEEVDGGLGRILMRDISYHWRFIKPDTGLIATDDFVSDLPTIEEALAEPYGDPEDYEDANKPLPSVDDIVADMANNNHVQRPTPEAPKPVEEQILDGDGVNLLDINSPRIAKSKGRPTGSRNKKGTITRAEKAKTKSTKRDPSGFEHVDASIQASRGGKSKGKRGGGGGAVSTSRSTATARGKTLRKQLKALESFTAATIDADIQAMEKENAIIEEDIRGIITRQAARQTVKASASVATTEGTIHIDSDVEFDGADDASSADDWMYERGN